MRGPARSPQTLNLKSSSPLAALVSRAPLVSRDPPNELDELDELD